MKATSTNPAPQWALDIHTPRDSAETSAIIRLMIDWQSIDTVLLDMDGTLLDLHFDNYFWLEHLPRRYAEERGIDEARAKRDIDDKIRELEGTLEWYCLDHWSELINMDIPALKREMKNKIQLRPYAEEFLRRLRALNKKLILITNSHPKGLSLKMEVTRIDSLLDVIISSHAFSTPKEDALFWQTLKQKEPFDCSRTLFIDDTPRILRSAAAFGIQHLICIVAPDSQRDHKSSEEFVGIAHFDEIMPEIA